LIKPDLHDEFVQTGKNIKEILFLPHFWDIESSLENNTFNAEVSFIYQPEELEGLNITDPSKLAVFTYNETGEIWQEVPSTVDADNNLIKFNTTHFSRYAIGVKKWQDITDNVKAIKNFRHCNRKSSTIKVNVRLQNKTKENISGELRLIIKDINKQGVELLNPDGITQDGNFYIEAGTPYNQCIFTGTEADFPNFKPSFWLKRQRVDFLSGLLKRWLKPKIAKNKPLTGKVCETIIKKYPELEDKFEYVLAPKRMTKSVELEFRARGKKSSIQALASGFVRFNFDISILDKVIE